jgi:triosephosphate isomerase
MRKPFVAGNWKMHGSKAMIASLITELSDRWDLGDKVDVAVCPPAIYIDYTQRCLNNLNIQIGAQNMAVEEAYGAFTGEISAPMLKDFDCRYVILGHSERRSMYKETDEEIAQKVEVALKANITPILCVGETLEDRDAGVTEQAIAQQMDAVIARVGGDAFAKIVIAYEPVWAIGTGKAATPEQAQEVHALIRDKIRLLSPEAADAMIILHGGSVKPGNARDLFSQPDIDGGLIGGASLVAEDFLAICRAAAEVKG